jgi:hypothetical protein
MKGEIKHYVLVLNCCLLVVRSEAAVLALGKYLVRSGGQHAHKLLPRLLLYVIALPFFPWQKTHFDEAAEVDSFVLIVVFDSNSGSQAAESFSYSLVALAAEVITVIIFQFAFLVPN